MIKVIVNASAFLPAKDKDVFVLTERRKETLPVITY